MRKEKPKLKCKHLFEHKIIEGKNMSGKERLWIIHKCKKCGLESDGLLLIEENSQKSRETK